MQVTGMYILHYNFNIVKNQNWETTNTNDVPNLSLIKKSQFTLIFKLITQNWN